VRSDLTVALGSYAPVQFVANGADVTDPDLVVVNGGVVVTLGRIQLRDDKAQVPLSVRRNGLNGRGLTYQLTREAATWRVEGTVGPAWIS
jgi:lipopolysaccharide export system protein LptA